jgi:hypothetical protein
MDWVVWFLSLGWELGIFFLFLIFVFELVQYTYVWYEPAGLYQECISIFYGPGYVEDMGMSRLFLLALILNQ